jgi:predicted O-linked N-acetylglucosamine transferase (SPINDLY family)
MDSDNFEMAKNFFLDGLKYFQNQEFKDAELSFLKSLELVPNRASILNNLAATQIKLNKLVEAEKNLQIVNAIDKKSIDLWLNLGLLSLAKNHLPEAINYFLKCLEIDSLNISAQKLLAQTYDQRQEFDQAIACFKKMLELSSSDMDALISLGAILNDLKRYNESVQYSQSAIQIDRNSVNGYVNLGVALHGLGNFDLALQNYTKALELDFSDPEIWLNKGVTIYSLKLYDEALTHYDKALRLKPDYAEGWSNKGLTLHELKRYDEALAHYDKALSLKPDFAEGWSNKGNTLHELKRYDEAIAHYDKALILKPGIDWIFGDLLHAKMKICSWSDLAESLDGISKKIGANEKVIQPFPLLALSDNALLHKKCSQLYAQAKYPFNLTLGSIQKSVKKEKIRIAYFSPDFRNHAVSYLTAELYELHDRNKFEIIAFSFGVDDKSEMRSRLSKAFDRFFDVSGMSDLKIAKLARNLQIDIAVDLSGHTQDCRPGMFSYRAAPIQVNWLGYSGTIGADFIDYIVADKIIIPESHQQFYCEKIAYLPNTYIVDDSKRVASSKKFTRENFGLPDGAFVFCCFNNDYKFNPHVLDSWSRILLTAKNSVIWISENNENFRVNIVAEFKNRGIDSDRIIFAQRVEMMSDHLARYSLADLFLDTNPYGAHTTAIDSLKAGVPVLTLMGQSFASRVAASLLNGIGLPELITTTKEVYETLAIELSRNPQKLGDIKLRLAHNRQTTPLFNTPMFAKNIEAAYIQMYERYRADLQPDHIFIT